MKKLTILILTATALSVATASKRTDYLVQSAREAGWTETQIDRLQALCSDYERAATALRDFQQLSGLTPKPAVTTVTADLRDKSIRQIADIAKASRNRYEVLRNTVTHHDPTRTNLFARTARASMQTKLDEARQRAEAFYVQATNHLARLETVRSELTNMRDEYQAKSSSGSVITKPVYKAIVQVFDSIIAKFDNQQ